MPLDPHNPNVQRLDALCELNDALVAVKASGKKRTSATLARYAFPRLQDFLETVARGHFNERAGGERTHAEEMENLHRIASGKKRRLSALEQANAFLWSWILKELPCPACSSKTACLK